MTGTDAPRPLSTTLLWAVRLLYAQAVALGALTAYLLILTLTSGGLRVAVALALIVLAAIAAASVFTVARFLGRRRPGARGPAIVVQLFVIASGGLLVQTGPLWAGLLLMALGILIGLLVVTPSSSRALGVG